MEKLFERIGLNRLNKHIIENNIIQPEQQHSFRSTTTQLNNIINHIQSNINNKLSTSMVLLDIEKAFDRVWLALRNYL